ncbi:unnamed protein product [Musa acuminata subsp. malaccensis]|nr:unnamed protein product [Musa acuminata subsp. malaccensis]
MMSCNPSERPTGRVLSIIKSSPYRGTVIGLLALNPWLPEGEENGRELDYVQLMPTDAKLPMMVITVESLPGCAKKRLINDDVSIERELVAAQIEESKEGSVCPKAQVIRMLGRAEEIGPQISAVLFKHAISAADFSPESLSYIDDTGNITGLWIDRSIIHSCCKLSYDDVQDIIDGGFEVDVSGKTVPKLHGQFENGAFWIETPKLVFLLDESGNPNDSFLGVRKESSCLVEELMLLANGSVAEVISKAFPGCAIHRRHAEPMSMKLKEFQEFCRKRGLELDVSSSGKLQLALPKMREKLKNDPVLLQILLARAARTMQLAGYFWTGDLRGREDEWAHYGWSIPLYTHFTSPLRRYADIIVHRTLAAVVEAEEVYMEKRQSIVAYCNERKSASKHAEQSARKCLSLGFAEEQGGNFIYFFHLWYFIFLKNK